MADLDPPARHLVAAGRHLRAADSDLKMVLTLLRQERREVPPAVEDAIALVEDALTVLDG
jgi:hypothetical protein